MAAITIRNVPDPLYSKLKANATANHRSINAELIHCLEQILLPKPIEPLEHIQQVRALREGIPDNLMDVDDIQGLLKQTEPNDCRLN